MKRDIPSSADEPLRELLRSARPEATLPPRFEESVWQRIARPEPRSPHRFSAWLDTLVEWTAQPRWAFGGLAVVIHETQGREPVATDAFVRTGEREVGKTFAVRDRHAES